MFHAISKIFWTFVQPSSAIAFVIAAGVLLALLRADPRPGLRIAATGAASLLVAGFSPLANFLIIPLEERFPVPVVTQGANTFAGIIVLGGAEDGRIGRARGQLILNEAGERITEAVSLAHKLPGVRLFFSGGIGSAIREEAPAGAQIGAFWRSAGIAAERIAFEEQSRTTYENAVVAKRILAPKPGEHFLLVTSAYHMPRSIAAFRSADFDVTAYPVDFRTKDGGDRLRPFSSVAAGLKRMDEAAREWVGLVAYRVLGRSKVLFPAP